MSYDGRLGCGLNSDYDALPSVEDIADSCGRPSSTWRAADTA